MKNDRRAGRYIFLTLLGLLLSVSLSSQQAAAQQAAAQENTERKEPVRISIDEAVQMAFKNNLSLESSQIELAGKRRASNLSWNQFIPNVTVAGAFAMDIPRSTMSGVGYLDLTKFPDRVPITGPTPGSQVLIAPYSMNGPQFSFAIPVNASLTVSMGMFSNMKRLRLDYETGLISYDKAKVELERDVRKAYHNMLLLQENIELLRVNFANVERQVQMAQANYNAGLAPELTLLQARVARENMRPMIDQAESGLKLSMAYFAMSLGLDYDTEFELIPVTGNINFISLDTAEMISMAAREKPEVRELIQTIRMLETTRKMQFNFLLPALTVSWGMTPAYVGDPLKEWVKPLSSSLTISLGVRLHSLIPFSTDYQAVKATDDQIKILRIRLTQLITVTEIDVYNTLLTLERTRLSAEAQSQTVSMAQQAYRLTEQAYQAGLQDYFQVQSAYASLHQARLQMLDEQFKYLNGLIDLEYAIGVPFGTLSKPEGQSY